MSQRTRATRVALIATLALGLSSCGFLGIGPWHGKALNDTRHGFKTYDAASGYSSIEDLVDTLRAIPTED